MFSDSIFAEKKSESVGIESRLNLSTMGVSDPYPDQEKVWWHLKAGEFQ